MVETLLSAQGFRFRPEPFCALARTLESEPIPLGSSLAARLGLIYIQDRSSMLPPVLLEPPQGSVVLDLCASPGSKTSLLAQLVGPDGMVLGCEPTPQRMGILRNNLRRLSLPQTATALTKGEKLPLADGFFDFILLDPPCSGWGTENKHPGISKLWVGEKIKPLLRLQRKLFKRAADLLAPGGRLLYSTCTTNAAENEQQAAWAVDELGLELQALTPVPGFIFDAPAPGAEGTLKVAKDSEGQGFFMAAFTKPAQESLPRGNEELRLPGHKLDPAALDVPHGLDWSALPQGELWDFAGRVFFLHKLALDMATPTLRWQGLPLGRLKGREFRPDGFCRSLMPCEPGPESVDVAEPAIIEALLEGRGMDYEGGNSLVGLYFRGHALAWLSRKSARLLWTEK